MAPIPTWIAHEACTLPTSDRPLREQEFDALVSESLHCLERPGPTRLRMTLQGPRGLADRVRDLADRETQCCSFFTFTVQTLRTEHTAADVVALDIEVPQQYREVLDALAQRAQATLEGTAEER
ncbi:MAG: hypothetical protein ACRDOY_11515 [Nocardioidaceae bacterium]